MKAAPVPVPEWLARWRVGLPPVQPPAPPVPAPAQARVKRRVTPQGFTYPVPWPDDGGVRREPVLDTDHMPPLVVRRVGWSKCMRCRRPFFSEDVVRLRLCGGENGGCRAAATVEAGLD